MAWHYRGSPPYLAAQAKRLGISQVLADRARHNAEIHRVSILLGQLCERCHRARVENGRPVVGPAETAQIRATLEQAELECSKLHALAAATAEMIDEGWRGFALTPPDRHYRVLCDYDEPTIPLPLGDGTVSVTDSAPAAARMTH
jgi:hypothetical protein